MDYRIKLTFVTPMFGHGATDVPEVRPSSIRGQLHGWFRLLGGTISQERAVFGGIKQKGAFDGHENTMASRVVVRVLSVDDNVGEELTLPHKPGGQASPRKAYKPGATCEVRITDRLGGIPDATSAELFDRALRAWLLMGTLGFRSTRAAGSFTWECDAFPMPKDAESYGHACREVIDDAPVRFGIFKDAYGLDKAERARRLVSDSLGGRDDSAGSNDLQLLHDPLGKIRPCRKTSPLKYRIVRCGEGYHILATWDAREQVTGNSTDDFEGVVVLLKKRKPQLGDGLASSGILDQ